MKIHTLFFIAGCAASVELIANVAFFLPFLLQDDTIAILHASRVFARSLAFTTFAVASIRLGIKIRNSKEAP